LLPKRSQITDLLKNGPLSAAVCGAVSKKEEDMLLKSTGILHSAPVNHPHAVPDYVQSCNTQRNTKQQQKQLKFQ
jgi:hypothetical protein